MYIISDSYTTAIDAAWAPKIEALKSGLDLNSAPIDGEVSNRALIERKEVDEKIDAFYSPGHSSEDIRIDTHLIKGSLSFEKADDNKINIKFYYSYERPTGIEKKMIMMAVPEAVIYPYRRYLRTEFCTEIPDMNLFYLIQDVFNQLSTKPIESTTIDKIKKEIEGNYLLRAYYHRFLMDDIRGRITGPRDHDIIKRIEDYSDNPTDAGATFVEELKIRSKDKNIFLEGLEKQNLTLTRQNYFTYIMQIPEKGIIVEFGVYASVNYSINDGIVSYSFNPVNPLNNESNHIQVKIYPVDFGSVIPTEGELSKVVGIVRNSIAMLESRN